jgi:processing peptidase subunit beta
MVLVGAGGVDHAELVKLAEKHFSSLPVSPNPIRLGGSAHSKHSFVGSEVRLRDDELGAAHIAIAVEGVGWSSPDYFPMMVLQSIFGNWDRSLGSAPHLSSQLSHIISSNNLANSFMSFSTSYADTGLWGIYLVSENFMNLDDLTHFTLREWTRMSMDPKHVEVERAKSQLKAGLLLGLDGTTAIAEDIGRQLVTTGRRMSPLQIEQAVDAVTLDDVVRVAKKYLWDKDVRPFLSLSIHHIYSLSPGRHRSCWQHRGPVRLQPYSHRHVVDASLDLKIQLGSPILMLFNWIIVATSKGNPHPSA